jgi:hypothetical protein
MGASGFTGPPRLTGFGSQIPKVLGGKLPQDFWMHGALLAGGRSSSTGIELASRNRDRPTTERLLAISLLQGWSPGRERSR